ncbi:MAG: hypothetical protein HS111_16035 [Kofleriaceae bacterium]|nr:hypothetical protein [Kofleriaceae bacterium]
MPDEHKEPVTAMEALAQNVGEVARPRRGRRQGDRLRATVERTIGEKTAAIERAAHQAILRRLDVDARPR